MAIWHLTELRAALEARGWRLTTELPGGDYAVSSPWELRRSAGAQALLLDFDGLEDRRILPLAESYVCRVRGTSHVLLFRRRGRSASLQRARWIRELSSFVEAISHAAV